MIRYDSSIRYCVRIALIVAMFAPTTGFGQPVPTPGAVQEEIRRRPTLPTTPDAPALDRAPASSATTGVPAGGMRIPIKRFDITGNTVISMEELRSVIAGHEGRSMTLFEIYEVADELTNYYRSKGYSVATVTVPAQKVGSGTVRFEVVEGRIGELSVDGNKAYRDWFLRRHITGAAPGDVIAESALERDLLLLNDLPGLTAKAVVSPGAEFGESNLSIRTQEKRLDFETRFNNYGRASIGEWKVEADLGINAPLGLGDRIDFNVVHADGGKLDYFNLRYSAPVSLAGTRASAYFSRNDYKVDSDELQRGLEGLDLSGDGDNFGFGLMHPVIRSRKQNLFVGVGYDRVITRQRVGALGLKTKADISLMNVNVLYSRVHEDESFSTVSMNFATNFNANDRDPITLRPENNAQTAKMRVDLSHLRPIVGLWSLFAKMTMVGSIDPIVDTQQFRVGGVQSVRGYASSELAGDGGYAATVEIHRQFVFGNNWPSRAFIFGDSGTVTRKNAASLGVESSESISGAGIGFESLLAGRYRINLELAKQIGSQESIDGRDGLRVWFGMTAKF